MRIVRALLDSKVETVEPADYRCPDLCSALRKLCSIRAFLSTAPWVTPAKGSVVARTFTGEREDVTEEMIARES